MSYILEALRRAERERAQNQLAPTGETAPAAAEKNMWRSRLLIGLAVLLLVNLVVVGVLLLRSGPATDPAPQQAGAVTAAAPIPAPTATAPAPPPPAAKNIPEEPLVQEGLSSLDDLGAAAESESEDTLRDAATAPRGFQSRPRGKVTMAERPLTPETRTTQLLPPPAGEEDPAEEDVAEESTAASGSLEPPADEPAAQPVEATPAPRPPTAARPGSGVKPLGDMSAASQASFPSLTMEVHVYDPAPDRRFVLIGGKRYREGQSLPEGLRIQEIVPTGVVFDFRGDKVLYPIGRH
jgi:general secretion pathway protein B